MMFCAMAFIMRGAGCTINDMWDKEIDKKVGVCYQIEINAALQSTLIFFDCAGYAYQR